MCTFLSLQGCNVMEDQDLRDIGIGDPQHRRKLLQAARSLPKVSGAGALPSVAVRQRKQKAKHGVNCRCCVRWDPCPLLL